MWPVKPKELPTPGEGSSLAARAFLVLGQNSQNFLRQIHKIFVTLRCFYGGIMGRK